MDEDAFELIARVIDELPTGDETNRLIIAKEFAWALGCEYPQFDRDTFLGRCGVTPVRED